MKPWSFLEILGGGHYKRVPTAVESADKNDRKSKPWLRRKRRFQSGTPMRRIRSLKRGPERRGSNPARSRMLGLNRSSYAFSSHCMAVMSRRARGGIEFASQFLALPTYAA